MPGKRINLNISEELAEKLKEASKATGLPMVEILSQVVIENLDIWINANKVKIREEVAFTIVWLMEERRQQGKDKGWVIEKCLYKYPDISLVEMGLLGRHVGLKANWMARKWNELQVKRSGTQSADSGQLEEIEK